ncbi:MAG: type II toxin-antitoxin system VapC family toxin [Scrofimicrobium sp.]
MILVDTSVWIDFLHGGDVGLDELLEGDEVGQHPFVVGELALGSIRSRSEVLGLLLNLTEFPSLNSDEVLDLIEMHRLWGRGLSLVDAALLGSVLITPGSRLWTRDKRLADAAKKLGVAF